MKIKLNTSIWLFSICCLFYSCFIQDYKEKRRKYEQHIGTYILDTTKTQLGVYKKDIGKYKNLQIEFKKDLSFIMNMSVPFLYDSIGTWITGGNGLEDANKMIFLINPEINIDFYPPYSMDSIFLMNSCTPKIGAEPINIIYFKKLHQRI